MKFLDYEGLGYLIQELKEKFVQSETGKGLSSNDFTELLLQKLNGIEEGAERNAVYMVNGKTGQVVLTTNDLKHISSIVGVTEESLKNIIDSLIVDVREVEDEVQAAAKKEDVYTKEEIDRKLGDIDSGVISVNGQTGVVELDLNDFSFSGQTNEMSLYDFLLTVEKEIKNSETIHTEMTEGIRDLQKEKLDRTVFEKEMLGKVDKEEGKTLTDYNFDRRSKEKLEGIENGAEKNVISLIKRNGINLPIVSKSVDISVPTKLGEMVNDVDFQTKSEILTMIREQGRLKKKIVSELPEISEADDYTLYLIKNKLGNGYEEWFIVENEWEIVGDTASVDLSGFVKEEDLKVISTSEIDNFLR